MNIVRWLTAKGSPQQQQRVLHLLLIGFVISRAAYYAARIRFAGSWIRDDCMSIVPFELMRTDLLSSVWHFHAQPPLFSLFCGTVVKLTGGSETTVFHLLYLIAGCVLVAALYTLMRELGVPFRLAAILSALFSISPATILYENLILYTYPVMILLVLSALCLFRYLNTGNWRWGAAAWGLWAVIVLTRSLFHLVWFIAAVAIILAIAPRLRKQTVLVALVPFLLIFGWYAKNYSAFGQFGASSWMGMNIARITINLLTPEEKADLAREGVISELAFLRPFPGLWQLPGTIDMPCADTTGVAILDMTYTDSGFSNYNNIIYLSLTRQFLKDSMAVIRTHPGIYLSRGLTQSFSRFFAPANDWFGLWRQNRDYEQNYYAIEPFTHAWNAVFAGDFRTAPGTAGVFVLALYLATLGYWLGRLFKTIRTIRDNPPHSALILFMLMTIIYIALIGNLFELGENMRFRYNIQPFMLILFGLALADILRLISGNESKQAAPAAHRHPKRHGKKKSLHRNQ